MEIIVRIRIKNQHIFMGKGVKDLLEAIDENKSIKKATEITKISYPKALRMLKTFESELGFPAVVSEKGGASHGGSELTPEGRDFLEKYNLFQSQVDDYANNRFKEIFSLENREIKE